MNSYIATKREALSSDVNCFIVHEATYNCSVVFVCKEHDEVVLRKMIRGHIICICCFRVLGSLIHCLVLITHIFLQIR